MLTFPVLAAVLLLTLACLAAVVLAFGPEFVTRRHGEAAEARPHAGRPAVRVPVRRAAEGFLAGRASPRPAPPWTRPGGRGTPRARRRRSVRARSG